MQGNILNYSEESDAGIITGPGGTRYKFSKADWKENCPVISRVNVDFVPEGDKAAEIYCTDADVLKEELDRIETEKSAERKRIEAQKLELEKAELKNEFSGFYRSSDKKLWKGVLGGLSHKYGHRVFVYRIMPFALLLSAFSTKDRGDFTSLFYIFILICFTFFYLYAAKKWGIKEIDSISAKIYFSEAGSKFAAKVNSAAITVGALAGRDIVAEISNKRTDVDILPCAKCGTMATVPGRNYSFECGYCGKENKVNRNPQDHSVRSVS